MSVSTIASLVLANTTTNAGTITLPPVNQIAGRVITFKDSGGNFVNKALTLTCTAPDTFEDGTTTKTLRETYGTVQVAASGSKWYIISGTQVNTLAASTIKTATLSTINISSATATMSTLGLTNAAGSTISMYQASTFLYFNNFIVAGARVGVGQMFYPVYVPPLPVMSGLTLWFDANDVTGTGVNPSAGGLATWVDKSGTGNNGTRVGSGALATNPNRVTFNGSSYYTTPYSSIPTAETIFVVSSTNSTTQMFQIGTGPPYGAGQHGRGIYMNVGNLYLTNYYTLNFAETTGVPSNGNPFLVSSVFGAGSSQVFINGVGGASVATSGFGAVGPLTAIGGNPDPGLTTINFVGAIYEVIIYNRALSTNERQSMESYLRTKWGTP
jgi:hypothetical protein